MTIAPIHFNQPATYQDLFLTTKLQPPSPTHPLVSRPRLLQRLGQGLEEKLTLICAPAGSGKTTLCTDWLRSSPSNKMSVAWVSLDKGDNDPERFWHYIYTALARIHPNIEAQRSRLLQSSSPISETALIQLLNMLAATDTPLALVLDDYHLITTQSIHHTLSFLLEHMPAHIHLVLLTHFEPPLSLPRLRVRGQVLEIREADLRFTLEEAEQFFTHAMRFPLAFTHIQTIAQRTEGWIAGLHLAALTLREQADTNTSIPSFTGSSHYIMDYFLEEVLDKQSTEVQTFLLSTSILNRMCAASCAHIFSETAEQKEHNQQSQNLSMASNRKAQEMLEYLERTNLFLVPLDHQRHCYRYHHLFREALQARLDLLHPSLNAQLHGKASIWYEQQGLLSEAIEHALAAKDASRADSLLEQVARSSLLPVNSGTLSHRKQAVPEEEIQADLQSILAAHQTSTPARRHLTKKSSEASHSNLQPLLDPLSERELEVLHLLAVGTPNATIAQRLIIAPATVKRHLSNIFSKLEVANRTQAAAQARALGIL